MKEISLQVDLNDGTTIFGLGARKLEFYHVAQTGFPGVSAVSRPARKGEAPGLVTRLVLEGQGCTCAARWWGRLVTCRHEKMLSLVQQKPNRPELAEQPKKTNK